ncbi:MAG: VOC family protein [Chitinophagaceae bacterium]|nr:VOC family protein [Chitinophagaceae bacterium]
MPNLSYIAPLFIVKDLRVSIAFYKDRLGFEVRYIGPEGEDPFFAIVGRDKISIMLKQIASDILPVPNHTRHDWARLDAYISAEDPDALYEEYRAAGIEFHQPLRNDEDRLRGFELADADGYILFFGRPQHEDGT